MVLDNCHPRHLDLVAATYPELKIVAARPGWPWQAETIAVLMHKRNIWYELHGWSPKYHAPELKHDIPRRLKDRILFGGDYPLFTYERLVRDWRAEGYPEDVLDNLFHRNAERFAASLGLHMDLNLTGKIAIVGGASMGIGYGIARALAREGARVAITARREPALQQAADTLRARNRRRDPGRAGGLPPRRGLPARGRDGRRRRFGGIDILVNNDGAPPLGDIMTFDDAAWHKAVEQNLMYVVRMVRETVPHMQRARRRQHPQHHGDLGDPAHAGFALSVATWGGVIGYAKTLSLELGPSGINVNTICPGYIETTPAGEGLRGGRRRPGRRAQGAHRRDSHGAHRLGRRRGQPGCAPGVAARKLHYRHDHPGRRRPAAAVR